jgi:ATPase subunit of ABC transporter with duplicated ATPase domains
LEHRLRRQIAGMDWVTPPEERISMPLHLRAKSRKGQRLISAEGLTLGYDDGEPVLEDVVFTVRGRDRVAIIGNNGSGKTTLLSAIAGNEGLVLGGSVDTYTEFGYLSQTTAQAEIKQSDRTLLDHFRYTVGAIYEDEAAALLVWFGFDRAQLRQHVRKLSPGEVNKLALLTMTYSGKELLLLDEPTNHLDFDALDVVESALAEFEGTLVVVSHDRAFLGALAIDRTLEVAGHRVTERSM